MVEGHTTFYAVFEGSDGFDRARSATYSVTVVQSQPEPQIFVTTLYLDPLPRQAYAGDALAFSGILETADGRPVQGRPDPDQGRRKDRLRRSLGHYRGLT